MDPLMLFSSRSKKPVKPEEDTVAYVKQLEVPLDQAEGEELELLVANAFSEIQKREASLATHRRASVVLEKLLATATSRQTVAFADAVRPYLAFLLFHRYGSHVLQTLIQRLGHHWHETFTDRARPAVEDGEEPPASRSEIEGAITAFAEDTQPVWVELMVQAAGTHVARALLTVLSGAAPAVAQGAGQRGSAGHSKKKKKRKGKEEDRGAQERSVEQLAEGARFPSADMRAALHGAVQAVSSLTPEDLEHVCFDPNASGALQQLLRSLKIVAATTRRIHAEARRARKRARKAMKKKHGKDAPDAEMVGEEEDEAGQVRDEFAGLIRRLCTALLGMEEGGADSLDVHKPGEEDDEDERMRPGDAAAGAGAEGIDDGGVGTWAVMLSEDASSSPLVEAVLESAPEDVQERIARVLLLLDEESEEEEGEEAGGRRTRLVRLALHPIGNFVIQRLLSALAPTHVLQVELRAALLPKLVDVFRKGHDGVVWRLAEALGGDESDAETQRAFIQSLTQAAQRGGASEGRRGCAAWLLDWEGQRSRSTRKIAPNGARLFHALLRFRPQVVRPILDSFVSMTPQDLVGLACDPWGSRDVMEPLIEGPAEFAWARQRVWAMWRGRWSDLAMDRFGTFVLQKSFAEMDVRRKLGVGEELLRAERKLIGNPSGRHVVRTLRLDHLKNNRPSWQSSMTQTRKRQDMFADIVKPAEPSHRAEDNEKGEGEGEERRRKGGEEGEDGEAAAAPAVRAEAEAQLAPFLATLGFGEEKEKKEKKEKKKKAKKRRRESESEAPEAKRARRNDDDDLAFVMDAIQRSAQAEASKAGGDAPPDSKKKAKKAKKERKGTKMA